MDSLIPGLMPFSPSSSKTLSFNQNQIKFKPSHSNKNIQSCKQLNTFKPFSHNSTKLLISYIQPMTPTNKNNQLNENDSNPYYTQREREGNFFSLKPLFSLNNSQKTLTTNLFNRSKLTISTKANPLEIEPEDRIFDILRLQNKKNRKIKKKENEHLGLRLSSSESKLSQVYKEHKKIVFKLEQIKQQKDHFSLVNYQNRIIDVMSRTVSKDSIKKMIKRFYKIRAKCDKHYNSNLPLLGELEETEEYIIENANSQNNEIAELINQMGTSKYGRKFQLRQIYFKNVINPKKPTIVEQPNGDGQAEVNNNNKVDLNKKETESNVGNIKDTIENKNKELSKRPSITSTAKSNA